MKSSMLMRLFLTMTLSQYFSSAYADETKITTPTEKPKLMPSAEDSANEVFKVDEKSADAEKDAVKTSLRDGREVYIDGNHYLAFRSSKGTLLIPTNGQDLSKDDINAATCDRRTARQPAIIAEKPLSAKYTSYASLLAEMLLDKCKNDHKKPPTPEWKPEIGVKWKNGSKSGGEDKVFVSPKGVGAGSSF